MCEEVHRHQALAGVQLWYNGMHSPGLESREVPRGPSGLPSNVFPERTVYDSMADERDIKALINMYVLAAKRAEQAGFDIVEISGADSTLPLQFLERRYNHAHRSIRRLAGEPSAILHRGNGCGEKSGR